MKNNEDMNTRLLSLPEIKEIYHSHLLQHFPRNEIKPYSMIQKMYQRGLSICYGLFRDDKLLSYAFFVKACGHDFFLLDYYAVLPAYRSLGIGGVFLALLQNSFADVRGFFIEVENPDYAASENDKTQMLRRIDFYTRCDTQHTGLFSKQFGVEYEILFLPTCTMPSSEALFEELKAIYRTIFPIFIRMLPVIRLWQK